MKFVNKKKIMKYSCMNNRLLHNSSFLPIMFFENGNRSNRFTNVSLVFFNSFVLVVFTLGILVQTAVANQGDNHVDVQQNILKKSIKPESQDIPDDAEWRLFKGDKKPHFKWNHIGFDDKMWLRGKSGFGYGNRKSKFELSDMRGNYDHIFVRREFTVDDPDAIEKVLLTINSDGAFIAYLNGIEIIRNKLRMNEELDISGFTHELLPGTNVLSITGFNNRIGSKYFTFIPTLKFIKR